MEKMSSKYLKGNPKEVNQKTRNGDSGKSEGYTEKAIAERTKNNPAWAKSQRERTKALEEGHRAHEAKTKALEGKKDIHKGYTERTKGFWVKNGRENEESFKKAIKHREMLGDKL